VVVVVVVMVVVVVVYGGGDGGVSGDIKVVERWYIQTLTNI
jgi:hypothetical protein